jgi:hypothetical protein
MSVYVCVSLFSQCYSSVDPVGGILQQRILYVILIYYKGKT